MLLRNELVGYYFLSCLHLYGKLVNLGQVLSSLNIWPTNSNNIFEKLWNCLNFFAKCCYRFPSFQSGEAEQGCGPPENWLSLGISSSRSLPRIQTRGRTRNARSFHRQPFLRINQNLTRLLIH